MKLELNYLIQRHAFWIEKIGDAGIWKKELFKPVTIVIRPDSKNYNALFIRKHLCRNGRKELVDRIFIYNKVEDFDPMFLDSLIVHETIHQYIVQNGLKDSSTHGKLFRDFMNKINLAFKDELRIKISDVNPKLKMTGESEKIYNILLIHLYNGICYCAVINPSKIEFFDKMIKRDSKIMNIKKYSWAISNDAYFSRFRRCTKSLHGIKKTLPEMTEFCHFHKIRTLSPFF